MMIEQFGVALGYFDVSLDVRMVSKTGRRFLQDIFHLLGQDGILVLVTKHDEDAWPQNVVVISHDETRFHIFNGF